MSSSSGYLLDYLPVYYKRLYPYNQVYRWLSSDDGSIERRELSLTLFGEVYLRYQFFKSLDEFVSLVQRKLPTKIDIGAIYSQKFMRNNPNCYPKEKEIVFDIDMTDYDDVRTCCSKANICKKCWKFMIIACKILNAALTEDFGFKHLLWVFSGRRGLHCWVCDPDAKSSTNACRLSIVEYLSVNKMGSQMKWIFPSNGKIHPSVSRALKIIDHYFKDVVIIEQNILGTDDGLNHFLDLIDVGIRDHFDEAMKEHEGSEERWEIFLQTFDYLLKQQEIPRHLRNLREEIKLYYAYPRLDINVTNDLKHLLKAPFCVHPATGKICVPFSQKIVDRFDPFSVPTIYSLIEEINAYDAKTKEQEQEATSSPLVEDKVISRIKDYRKTSLLKYVNHFEEFLKVLDATRKVNETPMEFAN